MTLQETLAEISSYGSDSTKRTLMNHGAKEPLYGVKVGDLKVILKKIKHNQELALQLFDSGVYDAMYLAALVADGSKMTESQLHHWAQHANAPGISEYSVPWVAAEHPQGWKLGLQWIDSTNELIASSGWNTLGAILSMKPDESLDISAVKKLLERITKEIHSAPNRVRYCMNGFVISAGTYVNDVLNEAVAAARKTGMITVDMQGTACKVPAAEDYIMAARNRPGGAKKKKTVKC